MNKLLLRRRKPKSLGNAYDFLIDNGWTLINDEGLTAIWKKVLRKCGRDGLPSQRTEMLQLHGPDRHEGIIRTNYYGEQIITLNNGRTLN